MKTLITGETGFIGKWLVKNLPKEIEIITCRDKRGENTIGTKRNALLAASQGAYVSTIDDDDMIHDEYIKMIYEKLQTKPDCVSLTGIISTNGANPKRFIHSVRYSSYFENNNTYFRPPNHLNPMKRSIAIQFSFPEKNYGEDQDWAMSIAHSGLLKTEAFIAEPYYIYLWNP